MKKFFLTALGLTGILLGSCQQDDLGSTGPESMALKIKLSVQGMGAGETRATVDAVTGEETVNSLHLFFFEPSTDRSGLYQGYLKLDGPLTMNTDIELTGIGTNPDLSASKAYKILAVANATSFTSYLGVSEGEWLSNFTKDVTTESSIYKQMLAYTEADKEIPNDQIMMTGEAEKSTDPLGTIPLTLTRGLVRFDVVNSARATYNLVSVSIWNAFPQTSMFGGGLLPYETMSRIQRFYGVDNTSNEDIFGGLYAFPNQVISPEDKDQRTTCLIIGLRDVNDLSPVSYHRVNINAQDAMQNLKRNNVYRLTIRSVSGQGASSELEAYTGGINNINYKINYWDLDDDGLIQQNGNIILGIPTKRIRFGAEAEERTYDIFAFGGASGEQIVVNTSDLNPGLTVTQNGNTITVNATALTNSDEERTGTINITYSGLTATIGIIQSGEASKFLRITTPSGKGLPPFPYYSASTASVDVAASGAWSATIYQFGSPNYFTFSGGATTIHSTNLTQAVELTTASLNSTGVARQAFVLFSLDSDAENINSALVLTQRAMGRISLSPSTTPVKWDGSGNLTTTGGMSLTEFKFMVVPTQDVYNNFMDWTATLGNGTGSAFEIVTQQKHATDASQNYVIVKAKGESTGTSVTDVLTVKLDSEPAETTVELIQENFNLSVSPNTFSAITNKGGETGTITVSSNGPTLTWSAEVLSTTAASGTLRATHVATIVDATTGTELTQNNPYALTQKFKVKFPKIYYGDHNKGAVTATVKVKLWNGGTEVKDLTFTVEQNALTPKNLSILNTHGNGYAYGRIAYSGGSGTDTYSATYRMLLSRLFTTGGTEVPAYPGSATVNYLKTPNAVSIPGSVQSYPVYTIPTTVSYVHASNYSRAGNTSNATATYRTIEQWRAGDNGVLFINIDRHRTFDMATDAYGYDNAESTLRKLGWSHAGDANTTASKTPNTGSNAKIIDFIFNKGPFGPVTGLNGSSFSSDGASASLNISGSTTAVAILGTQSRAGIVIDPANRVVFIGENQFFNGAYDNDIPGSVTDIRSYYPQTLNSKTRLIANIYAYMILTAEYGSNFSDLFIGDK